MLSAVYRASRAQDGGSGRRAAAPGDGRSHIPRSVPGHQLCTGERRPVAAAEAVFSGPTPLPLRHSRSATSSRDSRAQLGALMSRYRPSAGAGPRLGSGSVYQLPALCICCRESLCACDARAARRGAARLHAASGYCRLWGAASPVGESRQPPARHRPLSTRSPERWRGLNQSTPRAARHFRRGDARGRRPVTARREEAQRAGRRGGRSRVDALASAAHLQCMAV